MKTWMIVILVALLIIAISYSLYCYKSKQPKTVFPKAKAFDTVQDTTNIEETESTLQELREQL